MRLRVLLTDANSKNALATLRSLSQAGYEVGCAGPERSISHASKYCSDVIVTDPAPSILELLSALEKKAFDVLIPVGARMVELINNNRHEVSRLTRFALPSKETLDLALDKFLTQETVRNLGCFVPPAKLVQNLDELDQALACFEFPFVIRSISHRSNSSTLYVHNQNDVRRILRDELVNPLLMEGPVQVQGYVQGWGEGFFALYQNGELVRYMTHKRMREFPKTGGSSWAAASTKSEDTYLLGKTILDSLGWHGPAMVEFKRLSDGTLAFVELNPKLWGSLDLTLESGVEIPRLLVDVSLERKVEPRFEYRDGVVVWWPLDNLSSFFGGLGLRRLKPITNVKLTDLGPHIVQLVNLVFTASMDLLPGSLLGRLVLWFRENGLRYALYRFINQILGLPIPMNSKIDSRLWVGAKPSKLGALILKKLLRFEIYSLLHPSGFDSDKPSGDQGCYIPEYLSIDKDVLLKVANELVLMRKQDKKVYLHCREGVGRAPTVAVAILVAEGEELESAIATIQKRRPPYRPTVFQRESLRQFAIPFLREAE